MPFFTANKIFPEKALQPFFRRHCPLSFYQKSEQTNEAILHKVQKTPFLGGFWTKFAPKKFFSKIGLHHILGIAILHLCAKNQQKLMSQSREKLVTDGRTDERTNGRTDERTNGRTKRRTDERTHGQTDEWTNGRTDGQRLIYRTSVVSPKITQGIR